MNVRNGLLVALLALVIAFQTSAASAQVTVIRGGEENPVITIAKSTLYGAATGVVLGLALSLVLDEDTADILKWSFVGGTFGGFFLGIVHVATRARPGSAMLQFDRGHFAGIQVPTLAVRLNRGRSLDFKVPVVSMSF